MVCRRYVAFSLCLAVPRLKPRCHCAKDAGLAEERSHGPRHATARIASATRTYHLLHATCRLPAPWPGPRPMDEYYSLERCSAHVSAESERAESLDEYSTPTIHVEAQLRGACLKLSSLLVSVPPPCSRRPVLISISR